MSFVTVGEENSTPIELYHEDHGSGPPVVLLHGWPLDTDEYLGKRVSEETVRAIWDAGASPWATWACPPGWLEDFGEDVTRIDVPTLILHGTADRILSVDGQGRRLHAALPDAHHVEIEGGPHLMCVTHATEVNRELLAFVGHATPVAA
jgi:non-heme chloroperoxidase